MLSTHLNLLSEEKKKHLQHIVVKNFIKSALELSVFFLIIVSITLLGGRWVLESYYADITSRIGALTNGYKDINTDMSAINTSVSDINALHGGQKTSWYQTIHGIASSTPENIVLSRLTLSNPNKRYDIIGTAEDRSALLNYVEVLRGLPQVQNVSVPLSELTAKNKIPFALAVTLK
jgi:hypothetical protein